MASSASSRAPVAISMGDPAGVGPEVTLKAAAALARRKEIPRLLVVGDLRVMREAAERMRGGPRVVEWRAGATSGPRELAVLSVGDLAAAARRPGQGTIAGGAAAYRYIVSAARMVMSGEAAALVTGPINKEWMNRAGHDWPGHSELLAALTRTRRWRMMFAGDELRLALVTVHMGLAQVSRALTRGAIFETIALLRDYLRSQLGFARPRIGVLGFNPHAGEGGLFGDEEIRTIGPAIRRARAGGIDARGPLAPDTAFIRRAGHFGFDAAVAMYHDQGLIALKTLEFDRAVNITLGLPFIRTSPDHGTAYDIAGRGVADPSSMIAAIEHAWRVVRGRTAARKAA